MIRPTLVLLVWLCVVSCDRRAFEPADPTPAAPRIDGWQFPANAPDDRPVAIRYTERRGTTTEKVGGQGAGLTASGDATNTKVDSSAPTVALPGGGGASGGTTRGSAVARIDSKAVQIAALALGTLLLIGGAIGYLKTTLRPCLAVAGAGLFLIAAAFLPGWFFLAAVALSVVLVIAAVCFALRGEWSAMRAASNAGSEADINRRIALAIARGVEDLPTPQRLAVKDYASGYIESAGVRDALRELKKQHGLPSERRDPPPVTI